MKRIIWGVLAALALQLGGSLWSCTSLKSLAAPAPGLACSGPMCVAAPVPAVLSCHGQGCLAAPAPGLACAGPKCVAAPVPVILACTNGPKCAGSPAAPRPMLVSSTPITFA